VAQSFFMDNEKILKKLFEQKLKIHQLENFTDPENARSIRIKYIQARSKLTLSEINKTHLQADTLINKNIENFIGSVEIPIGIAGPIKIIGTYAKGEFFIPLATTEGALVASTSRGATASFVSGIKTICEYHGITRAPLFRIKSITEVEKVTNWLFNNLDELKTIAITVDPFIKLKNYQLYYLGRSLWIRFFFDTDRAMGMNMATNAASVLAEFIAEKLDISLIAVSGNLCIDKKASILHKISPRGRTVSAEAIISREIVAKVLKTTPEAMVEVNIRKTWQGSSLAGSISHNAHTANIIAAIFAATGQDLAHVVDSSISDTVMEMDGEDLYVTIKIPSLIIGTLGGGTHISKQSEAIKLMLTDISGKINNTEHLSEQFAEIIAATVLSGEISLHAAIAAGQLAQAHQQLGQAKKIKP